MSTIYIPTERIETNWTAIEKRLLADYNITSASRTTPGHFVLHDGFNYLHLQVEPDRNTPVNITRYGGNQPTYIMDALAEATEVEWTDEHNSDFLDALARLEDDDLDHGIITLAIGPDTEEHRS